MGSCVMAQEHAEDINKGLWLCLGYAARDKPPPVC